MTESLESHAVRPPSLRDAIVPLVAFAVPIGSYVRAFGPQALKGPIQVAPITGAIGVGLVGTGFKTAKTASTEKIGDRS